MHGFALVGAGRISEKHLSLLHEKKIKNSFLVALCDVSEERAKEKGEKYQVPYFTDMHEMMEKMGEKISVLLILTPSGMHAAHCIELAPYGKHIVVEKPMALTISDANKMIEVCDHHQIKLFVVKQNRYNKPILKAKEMVRENLLGTLFLGTVRLRWCRDEHYYAQDAWRGTWKYDGRVFANQAIHHIDLLSWFFGEVETVYAKSMRALAKNIEAEDTGVAILKFMSGAMGVIEATTATRPGNIEGSFSLLGERGTLEVGGFAVNELKLCRLSGMSEADEEALKKEVNYLPDNVYGYGHESYLNNVVQCLEKKGKALVDGLEGKKSLEIVAALYESIEREKEVTLNFRPQKCRLGL